MSSIFNVSFINLFFILSILSLLLYSSDFGKLYTGWRGFVCRVIFNFVFFGIASCIPSVDSENDGNIFLKSGFEDDFSISLLLLVKSTFLKNFPNFKGDEPCMSKLYKLRDQFRFVASCLNFLGG